MGKNVIRISGCDLVYRIPSSIEGLGDSAFCSIPANPAYWQGTRIASVASTYSNYRPVRMQFHYVPQVSVNQEGTVVMGTLWNQGSPAQSLQQTLLTSNGGLMTQCYVPADTRLDLAKALPQNNFYMSGQFNRDTNPFVFLAIMQGASIIPGYFFVSYVYDMWNPVGENWTYVTQGPVPLRSIQAIDNVSVVLLAQDTDSALGPGTTLVYAEGKWRNNGVPYELNETTEVYAYYSAQSSVFAPVLPSAVSSAYDTMNISDGSPSSPSQAQPLVSRTPGTTYGANELNLWTRVRGAAGRFVKSVLVPTGKAAMLTLMNPNTRRAAQIAYNEVEETTNEAHTFYGYSRLNFANLAQNVRDRISRALGGDVTQMRDLLVQAKSIASMFITSATREIGDDLDDDCQGFSQKTAEESENTVCRPISTITRTLDGSVQSGADAAYYYTPSGQKVTPVSDDGTPFYLDRWGDHTADIATSTQASFVQEYVYEGEAPAVTQEFSVEQYESAVGEMVAHGIASGDGQTLVGAGIIGDFGDGLSASVPMTINNYAANTLNVRNEYSVLGALDGRTRRGLDPVQAEVVMHRAQADPSLTTDRLLADLPPSSPDCIRFYSA